MVWFPNARKRVDVTFGSRREAILQQIRTTAHLPGLNVFFSFRHDALSKVPTHRVRERAAMRNTFFFLVFHFCIWSPNARNRVYATFGSRRGAILQQIPTTAHLPELNIFFSFRQDAHRIVPTHRVRERAAESNKYFFSVFVFWFGLQMPENVWMQLLAAAGERFHGKYRQRHTCLN